MASFARRALDQLIVLREGESRSVALMFAYSFLAMTSYNIIRPITRSRFITSFGAHNLPWVLLASGLLIGVLMHQYAHVIRRLPRRAVVPVTLAAIVVLQLAFWALLQTGSEAASAGLYLFGQILGILLISQFWTLANDIYDARQAKRVFGFIGAGSSLGGALGAGLTALLVERIGSLNLLLVSAATLACCTGIVTVILRRHNAGQSLLDEERGVGGAEALRMLALSPHLRVIALVIGLAAAGSTIVEQQVNMVAEATGASEDGITAFLAKITMYLSLAGFVVQIGLTSRIHRSLGLAFALLLLPLTLGSSAAVVLLTGAVWAPQIARVLDSTLRYTVDKTTREILFLPLPADTKYRAKPFIDVTMDRFAKALAAIVLLVLVQPWGLDLDWRELGYASLALAGIWVGGTLVARREYLSSLRRSIGARVLEPDAIRADVADAATIETLVEELSNPDEPAVLYAITMLEALDKRNLITPLLLQHESPQVRQRALMALASTQSRIARKWTPAIERMTQDADVDVRAAALRALAVLAHEDATALMRRHLDDPEPRVAVAAATALANSGNPADAAAAEAALRRLMGDLRDAAVAGRVECAAALAHIHNPQFRSLLVPLLYEHDTRVVREAIRSARVMGATDGLFLPGLMTLLGHRALKADARDTLVGYGETIVSALDHALRDRREHIWLRRHIPKTLALIPGQASMDALVAALGEPDGFLRYKAIAAIERLVRDHPGIAAFPRAAVEKLLLDETSRYCNGLTLYDNLQRHHAAAPESLLGRALTDKMARALDRIYRLLGLLYQIDDVAAARVAIEGGDARRRARALEYLDNLLSGHIRRRVLPLLEDSPQADKVRHANALLKSRPRELDDTLAQLVHDDDSVVAASAIHLVARGGRWALADDLEYIVAHRKTLEPAVVEAAGWALRQRPQPNAAAEAGEALPVVELVDRVRAVPLFEFVSVDELFRIAAVGEEIRYPPGRETFHAGAPAPYVEFLLEGTVAGAAADIAAPAVLGLHEVLEGAPAATTIRAAGPIICLRIAAADLLTVLSDNVQLAQGLFRMLLAPAGDHPAFVRPAGLGHDGPVADAAMVLAQHPLFERASAPQLLALTSATVGVPLTEGAALFRAGDAPAIYVLMSGEVALECAQGAPVVVRPGTALGVAETLAGRGSEAGATVTEPGHALRLDREPLFDVLGDDVDLMQVLFSGVLRSRVASTAELP